MKRSRPRRVLRHLLATGCAWGAVSALAQGISPGPLSPEGYKLPGGFEPAVQLRTFYFDTESLTGAKSEAWAVGGWAGVRSPWWGDMFQVGVLGYTSQKLYGPDDKDGTRLLMPGQRSFSVLGEAWGAVRIFDQTLTGYRQLINRPYINPQDNRMVPNTFEAYTLSGAASGVSYTGGFIAKMKTRNSDSFDWMSTVAGSKGTHKGVGFAGADLGLHEERLREGGRAVRQRPLQQLLRRREVPDRDRRPDPAGARRAIHGAEVDRQGVHRLLLDPSRGRAGRHQPRSVRRPALLHAERQRLRFARIRSATTPRTST